jgi:hypothetical protein
MLAKAMNSGRIGGNSWPRSLNQFSGARAVEIPNVRRLLKFICEREDFEQPETTNLFTVNAVAPDATTGYLGWKMRHHD